MQKNEIPQKVLNLQQKVKSLISAVQQQNQDTCVFSELLRHCEALLSLLSLAPDEIDIVSIERRLNRLDDRFLELTDGTL